MDLCLKLTPDTFVLIKPCMWSTSQGRGGHIQFKVKGLKVCVCGGAAWSTVRVPQIYTPEELLEKVVLLQPVTLACLRGQVLGYWRMFNDSR